MNTALFHRAGLSTAVAATLGLLASTGSADWAPNGNRIDPLGSNNNNVQIEADPFAGLLVVFGPFSANLTRVLPEGGVATGWPISVTPTGGFISAPVADGIAGAYVAISRDGQVVVRRFLSDGTPDPTWPEGGSEICSATGYKYAQAGSDDAGGLFVIWNDGRNAGSTYFGSELYGTRVLADGSIASGWNAQGTLITAAPESVVITLGRPRPDGMGGAFLYIEHTHGFLTPQQWVESRLVHIGPDGASPPGWPSGGYFPPGVTWFGGPVPGYEPDGAGGAYLHWAKAQGGTFGSRLLRILASSETAPGWPAGGIPVLADSTHLSFIKTLAADGAGGVFACVAVDTSGITQPVVHRVYHFQASGEPAPDWPAEGRRVPVPVDTNPNSYWNPWFLLAGDMAGGVFAAWPQTALADDRFATIAAMHWDAQGNPAPGWPEGGRAVCDTLGSRASIHIAADLIGETYVVWKDQRPPDPEGEFHTYASRLDIPKTVSVQPAARNATPLDAAPNPFAGAVELRMSLAEAGAVRLGVFDVSGRIVRRLEFGRLPAGANTRRWDGRADDGSEVPAGLYFVRGSIGAHAVGARLVRVR